MPGVSVSPPSGKEKVNDEQLSILKAVRLQMLSPECNETGEGNSAQL